MKRSDGSTNDASRHLCGNAISAIWPTCRPTLIPLITAIALVSCSSDSSTTPTETDSATVDPVVSTLETSELKSTAASSFGASIDTAVTGIQRLTAEDSLSETPLVQSQTNDIVRSALALDDDSNTMREDGIIAVDPNEDEMCAALIEEGAVTDNELQACQALLSDLSVNIQATERDAGVTTYQFQNTNIVTHQYAANSESISLDLGGLKRFSDARDGLDPSQFGETSSPANLSGEITFSASTSNQAQGNEIAAMSIAVTRPITISDLQTNLSLNTGELFSLSVDNVTGEGKIDINLGAISATGPFRDSDTLNLNLEGITATADISDTGNQLRVSNLGLGNGPLVVRINSVEALRMTMETFGFTITGDNSDTTDNSVSASISIDRSIDIALMLNNMMGLDDEASPELTSMLELAAPAGTELQGVIVIDEYGEAVSGYKLTTGGPLFFSLTNTDENGSVSQSVQINEGTCFDANSLLGSGSSESNSEDPLAEETADPVC